LGGTYSVANDINDYGQVVGTSFNSDGLYRAFLYDGGTMTDLGTLGGGGWSFAQGINNNGDIVGYSSAASNVTERHAFLYSNGVMTDLGIQSNWSVASRINDSGQITGYFRDTNGLFHAFLYDSGVLNDLGTLGGDSFAYGINDNGQIVGDSSLSAPLSQVPIPSAVWLFGSGLLGLLGVARRRQR
jgi:probable HAF family extracellular repeat protein